MSYPSFDMKPNFIDSSARIKENSPICIKAIAIVIDVLNEWPNDFEIKNAIIGFAIIMMASTLVNAEMLFIITIGLNSMPTERKNIEIENISSDMIIDKIFEIVATP